ncbi:MAG: hypothetical protein KC416_02990 [Myxococcales bacterium]|nr:hypothetical protein [Myxococcales bacterium]
MSLAVPLRSSIGRLLLPIAVSLLTLSCESVTQLVVRVDTDYKVPCEAEILELEIVPGVVDTAGDPLGTLDLRTRIGRAVLPAQVAIVGDSGTEFEITARLLDDAGKTVVLEETATAKLQADESVLVAFSFLKGGSFVEGPGALTGRTPHEPATCVDECDFIDNDEDTRIDEDAADDCGCPQCPVGTECFNGVCRAQDSARYSAAESRRTWVNACSTPDQSILFESPLKEGVTRVDLPEGFDFLYYGRPVTALWVSVDGWTSFAVDEPALGAEPQPIDGEGVPGNSIFPFWENMELPAGRSSKVCTVYSNNSFYVTWDDLCFEEESGECDDGDSLFVGLELETGEDRIYLHYGVGTTVGTSKDIHASEKYPDRADGSLATIGLSDVASRACSAAECNKNGLCPNDVPCGFTHVQRLSDILAEGIRAISFTPKK